MVDTSRLVLRLSNGVPVEPMRFVTPAEAAEEMRLKHPTGAQLLAEIEAFLKAHPEVSRQRFGWQMSGSPDGVNVLRKRLHPRPKTVAKARAIMADIPAEVLKRDTPRMAAAKARGYTIKARKGDLTLEEHQRLTRLRFQKSARTNRTKAQARIDAGLSSESSKSVTIKLTQRALEDQQAQLARGADPVEQALTRLRRDRNIVFRASVVDGPADQFVLRRRSGDQFISQDQLLELAGRLAA